MATGTIVYNKD
jgi:hypothetical protein